MPCLIVLAASLLASANPPAQRSAREAAEAFSLDSVGATQAPPETSTVDPADVEPPVAPPSNAGVEPTVPPAPPSRSTANGTSPLDRPIAQLIGTPATKRVLDRDLPGLSDDSNLAKFRSMTLRQFQPLTGGQLTDEMLAKVERDLAAAQPDPTVTRRVDR